MYYSIILADPPADDPLSSLISILFYVARVLVILIGGGSGLFLIVKGKSDEDPKLFRDGILAIVLGAVLFAATFAVQLIFTK